MLVSVTEIQTWQRCRRKRQLTSLSQEGLTPLWPNKNLILGSWVHTAGEQWILEWNTDPKAASNYPTLFAELVTRAAKDTYKEIVKVYDRKLHANPTERQEEEFWKNAALASSMCQNYQDYYKKPIPDGYELVRPEQQVVVPIPGTEYCNCTKTGFDKVACCEPVHPWQWKEACEGHGCLTTHFLEGTLDAILGDIADRLFVYERKTFGQHPNPRDLHRAWQFLAYVWILKQTVLHWQSNPSLYEVADLSSVTVAGLLYDGLWKREHAPTTGKYKGSVESLFLRDYMDKTDEELEEFLKDLVATVMEMANPNTYISHHIPALGGCRDCDLIDVCDGITKGEDTRLLKRLHYVNRQLTPAFKDFYGEDTD